MWPPPMMSAPPLKLMSKSILIIYTGGTIGMERTELGLGPVSIERFAPTFLCRVETDRYRTGHALSNVGVVGGADMTAAAAYTKLPYLLACRHPATEVGKLVGVNLRGKLTPVET